MSQKLNPQPATNDDTNATVTTNELSDQQLDEISGGGATVTHDDELPKEEITFEYGALVIRYGQQ